MVLYDTFERPVKKRFRYNGFVKNPRSYIHLWIEPLEMTNRFQVEDL